MEAESRRHSVSFFFVMMLVLGVLYVCMRFLYHLPSFFCLAPSFSLSPFVVVFLATREEGENDETERIFAFFNPYFIPSFLISSLSHSLPSFSVTTLHLPTSSLPSL